MYRASLWPRSTGKAVGHLAVCNTAGSMLFLPERNRVAGYPRREAQAQMHALRVRQRDERVEAFPGDRHDAVVHVGAGVGGWDRLPIQQNFQPPRAVAGWAE